MPKKRCILCARRVPWITFWGNLFLAFYKSGLGYLGDSTALIADGLHSMTDVIGTVAVLISCRIAEQPPDRDHPYGHGKVEFMSSAFVYLILVAVSIGIVTGGVSVIAGGELHTPRPLTMLAAMVSIAFNILMYRLGQCAGKATNSPALLANSFENRADAVSSSAAVVGIGTAMLIHPICDPLAGILVGVIIFVNCLHELKVAIGGLMDPSAGKGPIDKIKDQVLAYEGVERVSFARSRQTGAGYWLDLGIELPGTMPVDRADAVAKRIRQDLMVRSQQFEAVEVYVTGRTGKAHA